MNHGSQIRGSGGGLNNKRAFSLLSDVEVTENNKKAVANLIQHYALKAGVTDAQRGLAYGVAGPIPTPSLAYYEEGKARVRVTVKNGHISSELDDAFNLQNVLYHEFMHHLRYTNKEKEPNGDFDHLFVYLAQVGHESFSKSTREHQISTLAKVSLYAHKAMMDGKMSVLQTTPILRELNAELKARESDLMLQTEINNESGELEWFVIDGEGTKYKPDTTNSVD